MKHIAKVIVAAAVAAAPMAEDVHGRTVRPLQENVVLPDGIDVMQVGVDNILVRVNPDSGRFLLLPVQESADDATVNVLVDGKIDRTIYVRLAKNKIDYMVPFDLEPYKGKGLILDVRAEHDRTGIREPQNDAWWSHLAVADTFDTRNTEKFRPAYHHTPLYGWMNDPNGMVYKDGVWHLYYQYNPYGSKWQNMSWAHSTSTDLIHWEHQPTALVPDGLGAIFSGSSVLDTANTAGFGADALVAMYTSAGRNQMQSMAVSHDNGLTFSPYDENPVLTLDTEARDPNVFWDAERGRWVMTLAHALEHEMLIFTSPDLKTWTLESAFGKGLGAQGGVWECPDFFRLPVDGGKREKWVLLCNINPGGPFGGSATQYFVGDFDGTTFTADLDSYGAVPTKWMDYGKDHYATVSWSDAPDNRRVVIGWMSNWQYASEVPTMQFRSANTLPRDLSLFTAPDGQVYLASAPSPEVDALRGRASRKGTFQLSSSDKNFDLPVDGLCEIELAVEASKGSVVYLTLSNAEGEKVVVAYNESAHTLAVDRRNSGEVGFSVDFPALTVAPTHETDGRLQLRIFVDTSSLEVFGNDGRAVLTNLVFPSSPYTRLSARAEGGKAKVENLTVYSISNY